jgi:hypothetical protein
MSNQKKPNTVAPSQPSSLKVPISVYSGIVDMWQQLVRQTGRVPVTKTIRENGHTWVIAVDMQIPLQQTALKIDWHENDETRQALDRRLLDLNDTRSQMKRDTRIPSVESAPAQDSEAYQQLTASQKRNADEVWARYKAASAKANEKLASIEADIENCEKRRAELPWGVRRFSATLTQIADIVCGDDGFNKRVVEFGLPEIVGLSDTDVNSGGEESSEDHVDGDEKGDEE